MAHAVGVDETIPCPHIGSGEATERLLELAGGRYRTVSASADRIHFARAVRPTWALVFGIVLAPVIIGIPLLLVRTTETWVAAIEQDHRRVQVRVTGVVLPDLMSALVAALAAAPRAVAQAPQSTVYETVAAGANGIGSPYAPPMAAGQSPPAPVAPAPAAPVAPADSVPSELTSPAVPDSGDTTRFAGFAPSDRTVLRGDVEPEDRTMLRVSLPAIRTPSSVEAVPVLAAASGALAAFDTGERVELGDGDVVCVGRDPVAIGDSPGATLVKIDDESRSISKTHLSISFSGGTTLVSDLGSTNGTSLGTAPGTEAESLVPHVPIAVPTGSKVRFGERSFVLQATASTGGTA